MKVFYTETVVLTHVEEHFTYTTALIIKYWTLFDTATVTVTVTVTATVTEIETAKIQFKYSIQ